MRPKLPDHRQGELFETRLETLINRDHALVKLSGQIAWSRFEEKFGEKYCAETGRPGVPTRLLVGLTYLKYLNDLSDRDVLEVWVENPYWQYFCGEEYFQHKLPVHPSNLSRWRKRIGEEGGELLLEESLAVAKDAGLLKLSSLEELYVDTTVQEKNIAYPSEAKLLNRARGKLVALAKKHEVPLRQNYNRVAKVHLIMAHRYAAARQYNRARRETRKLRTILGRVMRDVVRNVPEAAKPYFVELLELSTRVLLMHEGGEKLYSLHEPHVEAIAKGKVHKRFEYGVKVSVTSTRRGGFVLGCKAMHGNPYDGHTLLDALLDVEKRVGKVLSAKVGVDLGYRGHGIKERFRVMHPRLKRLSRTNRLFVRARSKIEASISLLKRCFRLGKNYLKGILGDLLNALCSGAAHNLAIVLRSSA
jgi:IS5 family transposase